MEPTKKCNKCNKEKPLDDFYKNKFSKGGTHTYCKECMKLMTKKYNQENKEKIEEYKRKNKKIILEKKKRRYRENIENIKKYNDKHKEKYKEWRNLNKEKTSNYQKNYYQINKDHISNRNKKYNEEHREERKKRDQKNIEHIREYKREYSRKNPHIVAWRALLTRFIKVFNVEKNNRTQYLLGYTSKELKEHISNLFTVGMTWDNYGEWHIDHIKPLCTFEKEAKASEVNALSNLRPLWSTTREIDGVIYEGNLNRKKI